MVTFSTSTAFQAFIDPIVASSLVALSAFRLISPDTISLYDME